MKSNIITGRPGDAMESNLYIGVLHSRLDKIS